MDTHIECYAKAKKSFHTNRPYGIRIDYDQNKFTLFNRKMNILGKEQPGTIEALPMEHFNDVEDIPTDGVKQIRHGNTLNVFFYTDQTDPFIENIPNMEHMRRYNQFIYPLSLLLNRSL